jgi:hypothetical protein
VARKDVSPDMSMETDEDSKEGIPKEKDEEAGSKFPRNVQIRIMER